MIPISVTLKHGFRWFVLFIMASLLGCSGNEANTQAKILYLHSGEQHDFSSIKADFVLMNYWAVWCKPCVKEIPELNKLNEHPNVAVYAYNFDRLQGEELNKQASLFNLAVPMLLNEPAPVFEEQTPAALPASLVINTKTGEKKWLMGPQTEHGLKAKFGLL